MAVISQIEVIKWPAVQLPTSTKTVKSQDEVYDYSEQDWGQELTLPHR